MSSNPLNPIIAAVKADLNIHDNAVDAPIVRKVTAAWKEMEQWCNQPLVAVPGNVTFTRHWRAWDAPGALILDYFPVQKIDSITWLSATIGDPATVTTVDAAEYARQGVMLVYPFTMGRIYQITLTVGAKDFDAIPDLVDLCGEIARVKLRGTQVPGAGTDWLGKTTISVAAAGQPTKTTALASTVALREDWQQRLAGYVRLP